MLKLSCEYKELLKNIFKDNTVIIDYVIAYNSAHVGNFINFKLTTIIDKMPTTIEELFKINNRNIEDYITFDNINILITINNMCPHLKFQFIEIIYKDSV